MRIPLEDILAKRTAILSTLIDFKGLKESELSDALGIERKTINNHLRWLRDNGKVRKEGLVWYANKDSNIIQLINETIDLLNKLKYELEKQLK